VNDQDKNLANQNATVMISVIAQGISELAAKIALQTEVSADLASHVANLTQSLDKLVTEVTELRSALQRQEVIGNKPSLSPNDRAERRFRDFRRRVERHPLVLEIHKLIGYPDSQSHTLDINNLGVQLETNISLKLNEVVEFNLFFPGEKTASTFIGEVAWIKQVSLEPERYLAGINFLNPYRGLSRVIYKNKGLDHQAVSEDQSPKKKRWWRRFHKSKLKVTPKTK
jgi:hypothetical protein